MLPFDLHTPGAPSRRPFGLLLLLLLLLAGCSSGGSVGGEPGDAAAPTAAALTGAVRSSITARPDASCTSATLGTHDYWICSASKTFQAAQVVCASVGMDLARIDTAAEDDFLKGKIGSDSWIGATDSVLEGNWRWLTGDAQFWNGKASGSAVGGLYTRWTSGEPNDLFGEDCGSITKSTGEWNDLACNLPKAFVCESTPATANQPQAPDTACTRLTRNGSAYWMCQNARSWDDARANCQSIGMDLVSVDDAQESSFLAPQITCDTHIGHSDRVQEGTWRSVASGAPSYCGDGAGSTPYGAYANWGSGQPARANDCRRIDGDGGHSYWVCSNRVTWQAANDACVTSGMALARIDDAAENALLTSALSVDSWLGGNDRVAEGQWRWPDTVQFWSGAANGAAIAGRFTSWSAGEPNNQIDEDCLLLYQNGKWNDTICDVPLNGFVCEGASGAGAPDTNDCAFATAGGSWSAGSCATPRAYLCETVPPPAQLSNVAMNVLKRNDATGPRVLRFDVKSSAAVKEPFVGRDEELGLRTCVDALKPLGSPVLLPQKNAEQVRYAQYFKGVRVYGRGYSVYRDPTTKNVSSVLGDVVPNLDANVSVAVTESQARPLALAAIGGVASQYPSIPAAELVLFPVRQGPASDWELTWLFKLRKNSTDPGSTVGISARTSTVVFSSDERRYCVASPLPSPVIPSTLDVQAFQQVLDGDPSKALVRATTNSADALPIYLSSVGATPIAGKAVSSAPPMQMSCGLAPDWSQVMRVGKGPISYADQPSDDQMGAAMFLATQTTLQKFSELFEVSPNVPWVGIDGRGVAPVNLTMVRGGGNKDQYLGSYILFDLDTRPAPGANLDYAGHELGHAIWEQFASAAHEDLETRAVEEGFGDILAATVEAVQRDGLPDTGADCGFGDAVVAKPGQQKECPRDFFTPGASTQPGCHVEDANGVFRAGCPADYASPDYCTAQKDCKGGPIDASCCDVHTNATVFDHWYYIVRHGDKGMNALYCPYDVKALDPALAASSAAAGKIVFNTLRDLGWNSLNYPDFAEASIRAASDYFGKDAAQSVANAWYAVGVRPDTIIGTDGQDQPVVTPARGAKKVHPWVTFSWRAPAGETSWDFQLDDDNFRTSKVLWEKRDITTTTTVNGQRTAYFTLALPENTTAHYVWRVRPKPPQPDTPWFDCYAVHWFDDTGPLTGTDLFFAYRDANGLLQPGSGGVGWHELAGVEPVRYGDATTSPVAVAGYKVLLSPDPAKAGCGSPGEYTFAPMTIHNLEFDGTYIYAAFPVAPNSRYYGYVQPIGPTSIITGKPALGPCQTGSIDSGTPSEQPRGLRPWGGAFNLYSPHERDPSTPVMTPTLEWDWEVQSWATGSQLQFKKLDAAGNCPSGSSAVVLTKNVPMSKASCDGVWCAQSYKGDLFPNPAPGGYCWEVTAIDATGKVAGPTATGKWSYYVDASTAREPGVLPTSGTAGALPGNTYDHVVTLKWTRLPSALKYHVKVWKWMSGFGDAQLSNVAFVDRDTEPGKNSLDVASNEGGRGRYCWELTPILEDPEKPGVIAPRQPKVYKDAPLCYTTGPSQPFIFFDNRPASGYARQDVTGEVVFPYVADKELWTNEGNGWNWDSSTVCTTYNQVFKDVVDCHRRFKIPVGTGPRKVDMIVRVFNSARFPGTTEKSEQIFETKASVEIGRCGLTGEACCPESEVADQCEQWSQCDDQPLVQNDNQPTNRCVPCGNHGGICCNKARNSSWTDGDNCKTFDETCGFVTWPSKAAPLGTLACDRQCGRLGNPCCNPSTLSTKCDSGLFCASGGYCELQQNVSPGTCSTDIVAGQNQSVIRDIDVGLASGMTRFSVNTFNVPDNVLVTQGGQVVVNTGCVGTNSIEDTCKVTDGLSWFTSPGCDFDSTPNIYGCWCCQSGKCWTDVPINGTTSVLTTSVQPNCAGTPDTAWTYQLSCATPFKSP